jgi:endo-1,4-beta-xylanase
MTRREALMHGLGLVAWGALAQTAPSLAARFSASSITPLKTVSACTGSKIGVVADKASLQDPVFARIVTQNFNMLTASGMKWDRIHPGLDTYDFAEADWNMQFAQDNGLQVHGHNLCWNSPLAYPEWFKSALKKSNARQILIDHITTVMKRYEGRINSWDVVNEPVVPWSKRSDGLYPGIWVDLLGATYIDIAFEAAAAADPKALRVMNIYNVEQGTPDDERTRRETIALLKQILDRGVPVQAVGIESHLDTSLPLGGASYREFVDEIRALKLQVLVTELDVMENRAVGDSRTWDESVAQYYGDYLTAVVSSTNPQAVIFWTIKDRWWNGKRIQGLMQKDLSPRLTYASSLKALQNDRSCSGSAFHA